MLKLVTLLVLVIALIAGAFAQEHTTVAAAPASAPRRAAAPSPAPAASKVNKYRFRSLFFFDIGCNVCFAIRYLERVTRKARREPRLAGPR